MDKVLEEIKTILNNMPENISDFYIEIHKSYEERLDSALGLSDL